MNDKLQNSSGIGSRIKHLREISGLSTRAFAEKIGVSQSFLVGVEQGTSRSGEGMLIGISTFMPDISLRWLLLGDGEMLASSSPRSAETSKVGNDPLQEDLLELRLLASRSSQATARHLLAALQEGRTPMSRPELARACGVSPEEVTFGLLILKRYGLVAEGPLGVQATGSTIPTASAADGAELALEIISIVSRRVLPAVQHDDGSGTLIVAEGAVEDPRSFIKGVGEDIKRRLLGDSGTRRVTLVLGVTTLKE